MVLIQQTVLLMTYFEFYPLHNTKSIIVFINNSGFFLTKVFIQVLL